VRTTAPDLIIADVNGTTLGLLDWLRDADSSLCAAATDTPVIVLTSNSEEVHRVRLLERGGDDVLVKPFCYPELPARIAAVLRRTAPRQPRRVLTAGPVRIDLRDRSVSVNERLVDLTANEYRLLCQLAAEPTRVFTREELMRSVWGLQTFGRTRTLDSPAAQVVRRRARQARGERLGRRLPADRWGIASGGSARDGPMSDRDSAALSVEGLYEQLAAERAGQARAALARERTVERLFAQSAVALEDAAGTLLHVAATFMALDGPLPGLFAEQAGALLAVAARFEEAADLTRASQSD
jgi:DNA-binding response OmpR family regulator